jgi:hypothetical protein
MALVPVSILRWYQGGICMQVGKTHGQTDKKPEGREIMLLFYNNSLSRTNL